jgi:hypothetical protein
MAMVMIFEGSRRPSFSDALAISSYVRTLPRPSAALTASQRGRQRRLAVVDVPDRAHVDVRLRSLELS